MKNKAIITCLGFLSEKENKKKKDNDNKNQIVFFQTMDKYT